MDRCKYLQFNSASQYQIHNAKFFPAVKCIDISKFLNVYLCVCVLHSDYFLNSFAMV